VWSDAYHRMYYWSTQHMLKALSFAGELIILTRPLISETENTHLSNEITNHVLRPRSNEIYSLRHLTHPSPNFYRGGDKNYDIWPNLPLSHPCFEIKQHIWNLKHIYTSTTGPYCSQFGLRTRDLTAVRQCGAPLKPSRENLLNYLICALPNSVKIWHTDALWSH